MRRLAAAVAAVVACGIGVAACGGEPGAAPTRRALEQRGYRGVSVGVRSGGGIVVARVDARVPPGRGPDQAAEVVWRTLPVRFDQLVVAVAPAPAVYRYDDLAARFGPRAPSLDQPHPGEAAGRSRRELLGVLAFGAVLAGAGLAAGTVLVRRGLRLARERRDQAEAEGPISGLGAASATADGSGSADGADAMPS